MATKIIFAQLLIKKTTPTFHFNSFTVGLHQINWRVNKQNS